MYHTIPKKRYRHTLDFMKKHIETSEKVLDLGVKNPFSEIMEKEGYSVLNTQKEDLDEDFGAVENTDIDVVTAYEILEHLVAPYNLLKAIKAKKLIVTIPLRLWFAKAYRNKNDPWDNHYHEFEDWQLDWLLQKAGWKIIDRKKWTNPSKKLGFRSILRYYTPRYYAVYAERII